MSKNLNLDVAMGVLKDFISKDHNMLGQHGFEGFVCFHGEDKVARWQVTESKGDWLTPLRSYLLYRNGDKDRRWKKITFTEAESAKWQHEVSKLGQALTSILGQKNCFFAAFLYDPETGKIGPYMSNGIAQDFNIICSNILRHSAGEDDRDVNTVTLAG